ncbi:UDP-N-acetylmuramate dehydrogenase [Gilvimarinus sp. DA14]|uniref:UDP-N-acetylmuramate dehydrogenase n=1 Tax=Gilvimarinus sp. DA14 TaxID=2956798 RepID=UPI0020B7A672|nr:UDP-N-acetylmuramate dehydrogenase [Gilvimarinus sp. DA14]UTF60914.1 UDP-N-acetylmuramate dehydrogenase [Gilvimarinus sp. DA14]
MPLILPEFNLARLNTLASPVTAWAYTSVASREEVAEAIGYAKEYKLPVLPLGGGSNLVLAANLNALVVHLNLRGIELVDESDSEVWVRAQAGENWHEFVQYCLNMGWYGLENLSLIPGSVGAAPIQNIGAYGVELESVFAELSAIELSSQLAVTFTRDSCGFAYRDSVFKNRLKDQYIICDVTFKLQKTPQLVLGYPALAERLADIPETEITPQQVSAAVTAIRREKLPDPAQTPNAGSFFKNPMVPQAQFAALQQQYPDIVGYPDSASGQVKLAAGWLIDRAGFKGATRKSAAVHKDQALVLTNPGKQSARYVLELAREISATVNELYGVALEIEPRVYPSDDSAAAP